MGNKGSKTEWVKKYNKKVELHRHLEGSIPIQLLWDNREHITKKFDTIEDMKKGVTSDKSDTLEAVLAKFDSFQEAIKNGGPEFTYKLTKGCIQDGVKEGINVLELRFSPQFMVDEECKEGEKYPEIWDKHMEKIVQAKKEELESNKNIKIGFIVIVSRNYGPESGIRTAEFARKWKDELVGFDFASTETDFKVTDFVPTVKIVHEIGLSLTVHTGEGSPPENIKAVLDNYAPVKRLGHATSLVESEELMKRVKKEGICIECCPTSNLLTNSVKSYDQHPVKTYLKKGLLCCINTDDPGLFAIDQNMEWETCLTKVGLSKKELLKLNEMGRKCAFVK